MDRSVFEWLPAEHGDGAKCPARILDTVLLDAGGMPASWLYTSKNGHVCAKKPSGLSWEKMAARFSKFALAHPLNAQGPKLVASAIRHDGAHVQLRAARAEVGKGGGRVVRGAMRGGARARAGRAADI